MLSFKCEPKTNVCNRVTICIWVIFFKLGLDYCFCLLVEYKSGGHLMTIVVCIVIISDTEVEPKCEGTLPDAS